MHRSLVRLPPGVSDGFDVYLNGVRQQPGVDFEVVEGTLRFDRVLMKDKISKKRWFLGAWGVGTYRQDDSVDVRYRRGGRTVVAEALEIEALP
jgi:hypothetical protein